MEFPREVAGWRCLQFVLGKFDDLEMLVGVMVADAAQRGDGEKQDAERPEEASGKGWVFDDADFLCF